MAKPRNRSRRSSSKRGTGARDAIGSSEDPTVDAIKAAEQVALSAFGSGLKLAAAFATVAAKTTGLALASLATGADKFSELVKEEALRSYNGRTTRLTESSSTPRRARKSRSPRKLAQS